MKKYLLIAVYIITACLSAEGVTKYAYENRAAKFSGVISPSSDAPYRCMFPWHIGRELKGFDIEGHNSFVCEFKTFWVDWGVIGEPSSVKLLNI